MQSEEREGHKGQEIELHTQSGFTAKAHSFLRERTVLTHPPLGNVVGYSRFVSTPGSGGECGSLHSYLIFKIASRARVNERVTSNKNN